MFVCSSVDKLVHIRAGLTFHVGHDVTSLTVNVFVTDQIEAGLDSFGVPCSIPGTTRECPTGASQSTDFDPLALLGNVSSILLVP